jgi:hypothetical protein
MKKQVLYCDVTSSKGSPCSKEGASTIHITGASYTDAAGSTDYREMSFEICPDHAVIFLKQTLQILYDTKANEFEKLIQGFFLDGKKPKWSGYG